MAALLGHHDARGFRLWQEITLSLREEAVTRSAEAICPIFAAEEVYREALAATSLLLRAAREGTLNALLFHRIAAFLKRARYLPDLRFEDELSAGERET